MRLKVARSRDSLTRVVASALLKVSRSSRPISVEAESASRASLGEMRISARRRSPMNSRILWSNLSRLNVDYFGLAVWPLRPFGAHRGARITRKPFARPVSGGRGFLRGSVGLAAHRGEWTQEDLKTSSPPSRVIG